jgi:hypothetical protein
MFGAIEFNSHICNFDVKIIHQCKYVYDLSIDHNSRMDLNARHKYRLSLPKRYNQYKFQEDPSTIQCS